MGVPYDPHQTQDSGYGRRAQVGGLLHGQQEDLPVRRPLLQLIATKNLNCFASLFHPLRTGCSPL